MAAGTSVGSGDGGSISRYHNDRLSIALLSGGSGTGGGAAKISTCGVLPGRVVGYTHRDMRKLASIGLLIGRSSGSSSSGSISVRGEFDEELDVRRCAVGQLRSMLLADKALLHSADEPWVLQIVQACLAVLNESSEATARTFNKRREDLQRHGNSTSNSTAGSERKEFDSTEAEVIASLLAREHEMLNFTVECTQLLLFLTIRLDYVRSALHFAPSKFLQQQQYQQRSSLFAAGEKNSISASCSSMSSLSIAPVLRQFIDTESRKHLVTYKSQLGLGLEQVQQQPQSGQSTYRLSLVLSPENSTASSCKQLRCNIATACAQLTSVLCFSADRWEFSRSINTRRSNSSSMILIFFHGICPL